MPADRPPLSRESSSTAGAFGKALGIWIWEIILVSAAVALYVLGGAGAVAILVVLRLCVVAAAQEARRRGTLP